MTGDSFDPFMPATELAEQLRNGTISPTEAVEGYLSEIDNRDGEINAYVTVTDELARESARKAQEQLDSGDEVGPLHGVPIALKDLRDMKAGVPHSFGSKLIGDLGFTAPRTSALVERLEDAGALILGKTNTPEFGHKGVTDNEYVGSTASPLNTDYNAGGSSGGSAAAVAAGMASVATGSDAGGSLRIPAAACGVYGHKPSYGLVPNDARPNAFGTKMHHNVLGPMTRTVDDAALLLEVMSGYHPRDPASVPVDIDFANATEKPASDLQVAYSRDLDVFPVEPEIDALVEEAVDDLERAGATVEEIDVDHGLTLSELVDDVETTFSATLVGVAATLQKEFGVDLRDHPGVVSDSLLELLEMGDEREIDDIGASGLTRTTLFDAVQDVFEEFDLLVTPTVGRARVPRESDEGLDFTQALTWPFNWTGHPAASVPAGVTDDEDGVAGLQVVGRHYEDDTVLAASAALERERPWHEYYPK